MKFENRSDKICQINGKNKIGQIKGKYKGDILQEILTTTILTDGKQEIPQRQSQV